MNVTLCALGLIALVAIKPAEIYPDNHGWEPTNSGGENVSAFIFHDVNRNGVFDEDDRPAPHFALALTNPSEVTTINRANLYGFVNLVTSSSISGVAIDSPGCYEFKVVVPEYWSVSTGNATQEVCFSATDGGRLDLVANRLPAPVGVVHKPIVSGRVGPSSRTNSNDNGFEYALRFTKDDGSAETLSTSGQEFSVELSPGRWRLTVRMKGQEAQYACRSFRIGTTPVRLSSVDEGRQCIEEAESAFEFDFELDSSSPIAKAPLGESGLEWINLIIVDAAVYGGAGYVNSRTSGKYVAYNSSGYPVQVLRDTPFGFAGANFGVAWPEAEGETVVIKAWRQDELVYEEEFRVSALGPFWFDADFRQVTRIEFSTVHNWQFVMDDALFFLSNSKR